MMGLEALPARRFALFFLLSLPLLPFAGCGGEAGPTAPTAAAPTPVPPAGVRDRLTTTDLFGRSDPGIVHNRYYQSIGDVRAATHALCGTLHFSETTMTTTHPDSDWKGGGARLFPPFSLPVVSRDGWLIPLERDLILSGHRAASEAGSLWNVIADPGRGWEEAVDGGYSRAAFPFTFTDNFVGHARNGLATFVFDGIEVSSVAIQITQETAPVGEHLRVDFSALVPATWDADCPADAEAAVAGRR